MKSNHNTHFGLHTVKNRVFLFMYGHLQNWISFELDYSRKEIIGAMLYVLEELELLTVGKHCDCERLD